MAVLHGAPLPPDPRREGASSRLTRRARCRHGPEDPRRQYPERGGGVGRLAELKFSRCGSRGLPDKQGGRDPNAGVGQHRRTPTRARTRTRELASSRATSPDSLGVAGSKGINARSGSPLPELGADELSPTSEPGGASPLAFPGGGDDRRLPCTARRHGSCRLDPSAQSTCSGEQSVEDRSKWQMGIEKEPI
jgi:hypothetical protein